MKKILLISIAIFAFTAGIFAQSSSTQQTTATATIIGPLVLTKVTDMDFGTIATTGTAGTVVLGTDGNRTPSGPALVAAAAGHAASFTISGQQSATYVITLPADGTVTLTNGANSMAVNTFTHDAGANPTLDGDGTGTFSVGATLSVADNQAAGVYNSVDFPVTINYN